MDGSELDLKRRPVVHKRRKTLLPFSKSRSYHAAKRGRTSRDSKRDPDCASPRGVPTVCPRSRATHPTGPGDAIVNLSRRAPLHHPLADLFERAVGVIGAALSHCHCSRLPRGTARNFLRLMSIFIVQLGTPRKPGEGLRVAQTSRRVASVASAFPA